jgi:hypothetical protein
MSLFAHSQTVFNKIIEDTIPQITTGVMDVDTGYVFLSGISNEFGIRSFAFNYMVLLPISWIEFKISMEKQYCTSEVFKTPVTSAT